MRNLYLKLCVKVHGLGTSLKDESGQDLIEYALIGALIALAATVGMTNVATAISNSFTNVGTKLATYTS